MTEQDWTVLGLTLCLMVINIAVRMLPFALSRWVVKLGRWRSINSELPAAIMFILLVFEAKELTWTSYPFGLPAVLGLGILMLVHLFKRNMTVSILLGVLTYACISTLLLI